MLTRARRRSRGARASGDAGVSLGELIIAMTLSTILGALTLQLFVDVSDSSSAGTDRTINTAQARNIMQSWSGYLHVADGATAGVASTRFEWLTPSDLLFYAGLTNRGGSLNATGAPTMIWLRRDSAGNLVEEQFPSMATVNTTPTVCRVLGLKVTATTLFTPDANGAGFATANLGTAPPASAGCQPLPVAVPSRSGTQNPMAVANLTTVTGVSIAFTMTDAKGRHLQEFKSLATLPVLGGAS
ncbi:MAG: Prepilin-type N-terminal cleavage/methylation protein [Pseudonocardiales bacterium]|jgi:type II secretory pathway component PulJ|nr:Prepilin-type N-terminal cleavage/methylation protein [Pseudonocardiales bacterium]